jgi:hypothetical protein
MDFTLELGRQKLRIYSDYNALKLGYKKEKIPDTFLN